MKLNLDKLRDFSISQRGNFRKNKVTWKLSKCIICGEYFLAQSSAINKGLVKYCTIYCKNKGMLGEKNHFYGKKHSQITKDLIGYKNSLWERKKGKDNPNYGKKHTNETKKKMSVSHTIKTGHGHNWKCGKDMCWYDTYEPQLSPYGVECRRSLDDMNILEVKCHLHNCSKWFKPNKYQSRMKISALNGKGGEHNFYCSDNCKILCPTFGLRSVDYLKTNISNKREDQSQLRQMVLKRDNYTCQECGKTIDEVELHCHHILPINESPIESMDVDNCITYCKNCHKTKHKIKDCGYYDLRC